MYLYHGVTQQGDFWVSKIPLSMLRGIWRPGCFALHPAVDNARTAARAVIDFRLHPTDFDQVIDISAHGDGGQADVLGNLLAGVLLIGVR